MEEMFDSVIIKVEYPSYADFCPRIHNCMGKIYVFINYSKRNKQQFFDSTEYKRWLE